MPEPKLRSLTKYVFNFNKFQLCTVCCSLTAEKQKKKKIRLDVTISFALRQCNMQFKCTLVQYCKTNNFQCVLQKFAHEVIYILFTLNRTQHSIGWWDGVFRPICIRHVQFYLLVYQFDRIVIWIIICYVFSGKLCTKVEYTKPFYDFNES